MDIGSRDSQTTGNGVSIAVRIRPTGELRDNYSFSTVGTYDASRAGTIFDVGFN
jgi:hypothetical protein